VEERRNAGRHCVGQGHLPGASSASPDALADINGILYFSALEPQTGRELWKSDGTPSGTMLVKDIDPSPNNASPGDGVEARGLLSSLRRRRTTGLSCGRATGLCREPS